MTETTFCRRVLYRERSPAFKTATAFILLLPPTTSDSKISQG
ncbi:MAG: hypothetical protein AAGF24_14035 [Cyanobacteria bacterium P01_H01_bin.121]